MNYRLLSQIFKSTWFIDPRVMDQHLFFLTEMLKGSAITFMDDEEHEKEKRTLKVFNRSLRESQTVEAYNDAPAGSVAIIRVRGSLMKYDNCGDPGTETIRGWLNSAMLSPNISGVVLWIDTPGGTVDGTQAFANDIANAPKPVVALVDGLACSAGVWITSGARHIYLMNQTAEMGSIGVMFGFMDQTARLEQMGIKYHYITADSSPDKNLAALEAIKGNYDLIKSESLNPIADIFINTVKTLRGDKIPKDAPIFTGKTFFGQQAIDYGLADGFGSLDDAVNKVLELAGQTANQPPTSGSANKPKKPSIHMSKFTRLAALLGVASIEVTDEGSFLNEEQLQAVEARLEQASTAETERDQARTDLQTAQASIAERDNTIAERDAAITTLRNARGTNTPQVVPPAGGASDGSALIDACKGDTAAALQALKDAGF